MIDIFNTIIQVVQKQDESAPDSFTYNDRSDRSEIIRYTAPLLLEIYPETNKGLLLPKNVFLINPYNEKQLIPADEYYEYLRNEEANEIGYIPPYLGAIKAVFEWEKNEEEKSNQKEDYGGNIGGFISGKYGTKEEKENKELKSFSKEFEFEKNEKPNFEFLDSDEFKNKFPIICNNNEIKNCIDTLKKGNKMRACRVNKTDLKINIRQFEQMFKFAIPYLGFECNIRKNYEKVIKEKYHWEIIF